MLSILNQKAKSYFSKDILILLIFFCFVFCMLFLGDGIQHYINISVGLCISFLYYYAIFIKKGIKQIPTNLQIAWLLLILFYLIRSFFSESISLSLTSTLRIFYAYAIFRFFYSISSQSMLKKFIKLLLATNSSAIIIALFLFLNPSIGYSLISMNLLFSNFGHNSIINILILSIPFTFLNLFRKPSLLIVGITLLILIILSISFSRAGYLLVGFYLGYLFLTHNKHLKVVRVIIPICIFFFFALFFLGNLFSQRVDPTIATKIPSHIRRQIYKPWPLINARIHYWEQAMDGFKEKPLIGHGPGTFYILSQKYQKNPSENSYFAHSFPFEIASETGLIGIILFGVLLQQLFRIGRKSPEQSKSANVYIKASQHSIALAVLYSTVEYNFNFLLVWILFWALVGLVLGISEEKNSQTPLDVRFSSTTLIVLILYITIILIPYTARLLDSKVLFTPLLVLDRYETLRYLKSAQKTISPQLIVAFHQGDSELLAAVAQKHPDDPRSQDYFLKAVRNNSKNLELHKKYITFLIAKEDENSLALEIKYFAKNFLPVSLHHEIERLPLDQEKIKVFYTDANFDFLDQTMENDLLFAKLFYQMGYSVLDTDPEITRKFWNLSNNIVGWWADFPVELASLEYYVFNRPDRANQILTSCLQYPTAAYECKSMLDTSLPQPGSYQKYVEAIPIVRE